MTDFRSDEESKVADCEDEVVEITEVDEVGEDDLEEFYQSQRFQVSSKSRFTTKTFSPLKVRQARILPLRRHSSSSAKVSSNDAKIKTAGESQDSDILFLLKDQFHFDSVTLRATRKLHGHLKVPKIGPQLKQDHGKLTLVLDIDETLVHSKIQGSNSEIYRQFEARKQNAGNCEGFELVLSDGEVVHVNKRPGLDRFLDFASQHFEVIAYTAGLEAYAKPLLDKLDPEGKIFRHRLYRESCLYVGGNYVKDLEKLNRMLSRTVLVDNNFICFLPQLNNGIPIESYFDSPQDTALETLKNFLEKLASLTDVRPFLKKQFELETHLGKQRDNILGLRG